MKKLTRLPDWDRRLAAVTARHMQTRPVWGQSDCLLRVADAVEAVTGEDLAAEIRGKYSSEIGAAKQLRKKKCDDVWQLLSKYFQPVGRLMAQRGDIVIIEQDGEIAAGFVTEYGVAITTPHGTMFRDQTDPSIRAALKVGR